jgi:hypothetical protein
LLPWSRRGKRFTRCSFRVMLGMHKILDKTTGSLSQPLLIVTGEHNLPSSTPTRWPGTNRNPEADWPSSAPRVTAPTWTTPGNSTASWVNSWRNTQKKNRAEPGTVLLYRYQVDCRVFHSGKTFYHFSA